MFNHGADCSTMILGVEKTSKYSFIRRQIIMAGVFGHKQEANALRLFIYIYIYLYSVDSLAFPLTYPIIYK